MSKEECVSIKDCRDLRHETIKQFTNRAIKIESELTRKADSSIFDVMEKKLDKIMDAQQSNAINLATLTEKIENNSNDVRRFHGELTDHMSDEIKHQETIRGMLEEKLSRAAFAWIVGILLTVVTGILSYHFVLEEGAESDMRDIKENMIRIFERLDRWEVETKDLSFNSK